MKLPDAKDKKSESGIESWHARGYDYGTNFTLNFCAPVVETLGKDPREFEGIDKDLWRNVSAYYTDGKRSYSIGYAITVATTIDLLFKQSIVLTVHVQAAKFQPRLPWLKISAQLHEWLAMQRRVARQEQAIANRF
jgi:hypothetical protein